MAERWYFRANEQGAWVGTTNAGGNVYPDGVSKSIIVDLQEENDNLRDALQEIVDLRDADEDPGNDMARIASTLLGLRHEQAHL